MRAAKVQASLRIRAGSPEPPLLAHTSSESSETFRQKARSLGPLNGWACAVKMCHDGMLEDTNSLYGAHLLDHFHKVSEFHRYNTRVSFENFLVPRVSCQASSIFFLNGIKDWNGLPSDIKRDGNFKRFKISVKRYLNSQMQLMEKKMIYFVTTRLFYIWKHVTWIVVNSQSAFPQYFKFNQ